MEGLKSSEQEAQQIVDAIPQTIAVLGPDGQALYGNRSLLQYTGLTIDEMTSTDFRARVFHPEDVARLRQEPRALAPREPCLHSRELRGDPDVTHRLGALRPREGRLYRRAATAARPLRGGGGRHHSAR